MLPKVTSPSPLPIRPLVGPSVTSVAVTACSPAPTRMALSSVSISAHRAAPRARLVPSGVWSTTSNSLESSSGKNVNRLAGTSQ